MAQVDLILITWNRLEYTKRCLESLSKVKGDFNLLIIDNNSKPETKVFLKSLSYNFISDIVYCRKNHGIGDPVRFLWKRSKAPYVGKIDNDTLVPPDWITRFVKIHEKLSGVAVLGGWHFLDSDFDYEKMKHRILTFEDEEILISTHVGGCAYIMKRYLIDRFGLVSREHGGWTRYQSTLYKEGYIIGYPFPFLKVEHLGDPDHPQSLDKKLYQHYTELFWALNRNKNFMTPEKSARYKRRSARKLLEPLRFKGRILAP